jgi:hypothetical protein
MGHLSLIIKGEATKSLAAARHSDRSEPLSPHENGRRLKTPARIIIKAKA